MTSDKKSENLNDVILTNGSLTELNSIDASKQYMVAAHKIRSQKHTSGLDSESYLNNCEDLFRMQLREAGYDGVIRFQTIAFTRNQGFFSDFYYEGMPVKKINT